MNWMGYAVGVLKIQPSEFWNMTPREFLSITNYMEPEKAYYDKDEWAEIVKHFSAKTKELDEQDRKKLEAK